MGEPLRVHFDQNCMNARGTDPHLQQVQALHDSGRIQLIANQRNQFELGRPEHDTSYKRRARARLAQFEETREVFRLDASPLDVVGMDHIGEVIDVKSILDIVFPGKWAPMGPGNIFDPGQNSIHDAMHLANAHEFGADVFLTNETAILAARDRLCELLAFRPRILTPAELVAELSGSQS